MQSNLPRAVQYRVQLARKLGHTGCWYTHNDSLSWSFWKNEAVRRLCRICVLEAGYISCGSQSASQLSHFSTTVTTSNTFEPRSCPQLGPNQKRGARRGQRQFDQNISCLFLLLGLVVRCECVRVVDTCLFALPKLFEGCGDLRAIDY